MGAALPVWPIFVPCKVHGACISSNLDPLTGTRKKRLEREEPFQALRGNQVFLGEVTSEDNAALFKSGMYADAHNPGEI